MPEEQREQRAALIALEMRALDLMDGATPIATERLGIFASETDGPPTPTDWPVVTWPLETSLRKLAKASPEAFPEVGCAILEGPKAQAVLAVVETTPPGRSPPGRTAAAGTSSTCDRCCRTRPTASRSSPEQPPTPG